MAQQEDIIVDIPENRVKFFGTTGKMLLPSVSTVVNQNGSLIAAYRGGAANHAVHLQAEGFTIDEGKTPKVRDFVASLVNIG
jgi:hypothetical protein